jgi:glycerate 2-kinase
MNLKHDALRIFSKALAAADAAQALERCLRREGNQLRIRDFTIDLTCYRRVFLVAVGKAAVPMARAAQHILQDSLSAALVVTKHGHGGTLGESSVIVEAGHPVPDVAGENAARAVKSFAEGLEERDLLLVAISGGASALLPAPAAPVRLTDKRDTTELLLKAGADIHQLNAVRKHLSYLKGGKLAQLAQPAAVIGLLLSDVIGDSIDVIGSGPTAPDATTFTDALAVIDRFALRSAIPATVRTYLETGVAGKITETPKPGDAFFSNVHNFVIGSNPLALEAAASEAEALGYRTRILSHSVEGEASVVAVDLVRLLRESSRPVCLLSGGETTVTVRGAGKGGRNQELALAAAIELAGSQNVAVLSAGTDGTDGPTDAAGAIATGDTVERAERLGMNPAAHLAKNDSYPFFDALGDLVRTGPTGTNVMDVHILLAR